MYGSMKITKAVRILERRLERLKYRARFVSASELSWIKAEQSATELAIAVLSEKHTATTKEKRA